MMTTVFGVWNCDENKWAKQISFSQSATKSHNRHSERQSAKIVDAQIAKALGRKVLRRLQATLRTGWREAIGYTWEVRALHPDWSADRVVRAATQRHFSTGRKGRKAIVPNELRKVIDCLASEETTARKLRREFAVSYSRTKPYDQAMADHADTTFRVRFLTSGNSQEILEELTQMLSPQLIASLAIHPESITEAIRASGLPPATCYRQIRAVRTRLVLA